LILSPSFKKGGITNHPVGVHMVELPEGIIVEERRGAPGVLSILISEMVKLNSTGYIRVERTPKEAMPRVGQVIISNSAILAAMHEQDAILEGVDALIEIENDSMEYDCKIQVIENVDVKRIVELHPQSRINTTHESNDAEEQWWSKVSNHTNNWTKSTRLPTIDPTVDAPEFIKAKAASMVQKQKLGDVWIKPGSVFSNQTDSLFTLASNLKKHGKPLLVICRKTREEINVQYDIPAENSLWLSQSETEGVQFVDIDAIKGTVFGFLEGNLRAVLLLEGLEYLASICGSSEVIEMVRELGDRMQYEDDCLLISYDEKAWTRSEAAQLQRAAPYLQTDIIETWNSDPESLLDHPLMSPPTEEELLRLDEYLQANTPIIEIPAVEIEIEDVIEEDIIEVEEPTTEENMEQTVEVVEPETIIDDEIIEVPVPKKGPRKAQTVVRKKRKSTRIMSERETIKSGLDAAKSGKEIGELKLEYSPSKIPLGYSRDAKLPDIPDIIPSPLDQVVKQDSSRKIPILPKTELGPKSVQPTNKKVSQKTEPISPLAARGVEINRNIAKRKQASSVPQKHIDIEKELESWRFKEEDLQ
tara:strand:- start:413 stop:2173 length:1761 start_codon:yes stop_codon:yes gene_type:complete